MSACHDNNNNAHAYFYLCAEFYASGPWSGLATLHQLVAISLSHLIPGLPPCFVSLYIAIWLAVKVKRC